MPAAHTPRRGGPPASIGHDVAMKVALTVNDFLRRAEEVYPHRIAVVDEPNQPADSWGS